MALSRPESQGKDNQVASEKTWQQTKSENTRAAILDATIDCFYELGYGNTTTEKVAKQAGVSRGAMLHHFPSRIDLVRAAVVHLNQRRLQLYTAQELKIQEDAEHTQISEGIESFWGQLKTPLYTVFHELQVAARTDDDLKEVLEQTSREFDRAWLQATENVFPDLALSEEFIMANRVTKYLLEGMAANGHIEGDIPGKLVPWLIDRLEEMFEDVKEVDRQSAIARFQQEKD
ncbi:MAG: TetR/AcrR family transcriptional regulator [Gammaproteobacteria bacterium]